MLRGRAPPFNATGVRVASNRWVEVKTGVSGRQGDKCEIEEKKVKDCDGNVSTYNVPSGGGCGINNGISIRVKCAAGHVVQFISREYRLREKAHTNEVPGNLEDGQYATGPYTADPDNADVLLPTCHWKTSSGRNRRWRTDSQVKSNAYYESGGSYTRSSNCMTTLDAPSNIPTSIRKSTWWYGSSESPLPCADARLCPSSTGSALTTRAIRKFRSTK